MGTVLRDDVRKMDNEEPVEKMKNDPVSDWVDILKWRVEYYQKMRFHR